MTKQQIVNEIISSGKKFSRNKIKSDYNVTESQAREIYNICSYLSFNITVDIPKSTSESIVSSSLDATIDDIKGITMDELRNRFGVKNIIKNVANSIPEGLFYTQSEFVRKCQFPNGVAYNEALSCTEFHQYRGSAGGIKYWGHPISIKKMKDEAVLK